MSHTRRASLATETLATFVVVLVATACVSTIDVTVDEQADFGRYSTWGWGESATAQTDTAPEHRAVVAAVGAQILAAMTERGLSYAVDDADLLVSPQLSIRRRELIVQRSLPTQYLSSHHSSPSYLIEGLTTEELEIVESATLEVVVEDRAQEKIVWVGRLRASYEAAEPSGFAREVASLMAPFPTTAPLPEIVPSAGPIIARTEPALADPR